MKFWRKKNKLTLKEQRKNIQDAIKRAMSRNDFGETERLQGDLEAIEKEMRKEKP